MNPLAELADAIRGWGYILRGRSDAHDFFRINGAGLGLAIGYLVLAILISVAAQSAAVGMPGLGQVLFGLLAQAVTVGLLALVMRQALHFVGNRLALATLLVPVLYALAFTFVLGIPLTLMGPNVALLAIFVLAYLIFRAAQVLGGMRFSLALAFALLCVIVLVVVPNGLYMLLSVLPSSA